MATAKQIAARKLFAERARSGAFKKRKARKNPVTKSRKANPTAKAERNDDAARYAELYGGAPDTIRAWSDYYIVQFHKPGEQTWSGLTVAKTLAEANRKLRDHLQLNPKNTARVVTPTAKKRAAARKKNPLLPGYAKSTPRAEKKTFIYLVQDYEPGTGEWYTAAGFNSEDDAMQYAKAYARMWKNKTIRVVDNYAD